MKCKKIANISEFMDNSININTKIKEENKKGCSRCT